MDKTAPQSTHTIATVSQLQAADNMMMCLL